MPNRYVRGLILASAICSLFAGGLNVLRFEGSSRILVGVWQLVCAAAFAGVWWMKRERHRDLIADTEARRRNRVA